ncbi:hypothetical protein [Pseudomonas zeae]|uniref:hypothetical protein n=1 Tax=Pseudomonas zeae TaxID=2745510 RepID=UPI0039DFD82D
MTAPTNPYEGMPLYHLLFLKLRDGGGACACASAVAELHGISVEELKAYCRLAATELIAERGQLLQCEEVVYDWAKS